MRLGIVMPVVIQNATMLKVTLEAVQHLKATHELNLFVVCNKLHVVTPEQFRTLLVPLLHGFVHVLHEPGVERSVAGAWNHGCELAMQAGAEFLGIVANDTRLKADCLDRLVNVIAEGSADMCSGMGYGNLPVPTSPEFSDGCDFSCFMLSPLTFRTVGRFDTNFRPAYYEDNDYFARVVLGGGRCRVLRSAQFYHHGSMTIRTDPERAQHVKYWFEKNHDYFSRKWGVKDPEGTSEGVLKKYYPHPFNDPRKPLSWFPTDAA